MNRIIDYIKRHVTASSHVIAYKDNDKILTYGELWSRAEYTADLLRRQGTSPVLVFGHKSPEVIISILACIMAHRAYVPIDTFLPAERIKKIADATCSTLLLEAEEIQIEGPECLRLPQLEKYKDCDIYDNSNNIVYIIFTSGSTGKPKGVPISATNLINFIDWISSLYPLSEYNRAVVLNQASFSFDLSVADLFYSLCNGHTLVASEVSLNSGYDHIYELMQDEKVNVAVVTPTFMKLCLLNPDFNSKNYPDFNCVYFCGELLEIPTVKKLFKAFPEIKIINAYGPTEATSAVSGILIEKSMLDSELLPVGRIDSLATEIVIDNGEIIIKGNSVFGGYIGSTVGGWYSENGISCYRTGDLGFIQDGLLYCKGRCDRQVKFKGYRIELDEIEYAIDNFCNVTGSAVIAKFTDSGTVRGIFAFITADKETDIEVVKDILKKHLPHYMIPTSIKIVDSLPTNSNEKIDRKALTSW